MISKWEIKLILESPSLIKPNPDREICLTTTNSSLRARARGLEGLSTLGGNMMGKWEMNFIFRGPFFKLTKSKQGDRLHNFKFFATDPGARSGRTLYTWRKYDG